MTKDKFSDLNPFGELRELFYRVRSFASDGAMAELDRIFEKMAEDNKWSMEANIPLGHALLDTLDISDYNFGEDYEVGAVAANSHDPDLTCPIEEVDDRIEELEEKIQGFEEEIEDLEEKIADLEEVEDSPAVEELEADVEKLQELLEEAENLRDGWESYDFEHDDIMWNTIFRFGHSDPDEELSREVGYGVVHFINGPHEGDTYLGFQGCGMDLSPMHAAYSAITFAYVDREWARHFETPMRFGYFKDVVGVKMAVRSLERMDILDLAIHNKYFDEREMPAVLAARKLLNDE